jgi:SOS-response transcriptional repressor LexA
VTEDAALVLRFLNWCSDNKRPPTVREIQTWCGFCNLAMVFTILDALESEGCISRKSNRAMSITVIRHPKGGRRQALLD